MQARAAAVQVVTDYQRLTRNNIEGFQRFCDRMSEAAKVRGMTEETLDNVLSD